MAELLERYLCDHKLERGQMVSGVVVRASRNEVILDVGAKCEGIVPERDLERLSPSDREALRVGEEVMVGGRAIPDRLPGLIEEGLAAGGVDWPAIPGFVPPD